MVHLVKKGVWEDRSIPAVIGFSSYISQVVDQAQKSEGYIEEAPAIEANIKKWVGLQTDPAALITSGYNIMMTHQAALLKLQGVAHYAIGDHDGHPTLTEARFPCRNTLHVNQFSYCDKIDSDKKSVASWRTLARHDSEGEVDQPIIGMFNLNLQLANSLILAEAHRHNNRLSEFGYSIKSTYKALTAGMDFFEFTHAYAGVVNFVANVVKTIGSALVAIHKAVAAVFSVIFGVFQALAKKLQEAYWCARLEEFGNDVFNRDISFTFEPSGLGFDKVTYQRMGSREWGHGGFGVNFAAPKFPNPNTGQLEDLRSLNSIFPMSSLIGSSSIKDNHLEYSTRLANGWAGLDISNAISLDWEDCTDGYKGEDGGARSGFVQEWIVESFNLYVSRSVINNLTLRHLWSIYGMNQVLRPIHISHWYRLSGVSDGTESADSRDGRWNFYGNQKLQAYLAHPSNYEGFSLKMEIGHIANASTVSKSVGQGLPTSKGYDLNSTNLKFYPSILLNRGSTGTEFVTNSKAG